MGVTGSESLLSPFLSRPIWRRYGTIGIAACFLLLLALSFMPLHCNGANIGKKILFEHAEFVLSDDRWPPANRLAWQTVSLPHEWRHTHPGVTGQGWYRVWFDLDQVPRMVQAIMLLHDRSDECDFFVNGKLVGVSRDLAVLATVAGDPAMPLVFVVPPSMLRPGVNVIHVRMRTAYHPANLQGLGRVAFGDMRPVRTIAVEYLERGFLAERSFVGMAFAAGLITLFVWFARRTDRVILWFSITCLSWSVVSTLRFWLRWTDMSGLVPSMAAYSTWGLVIPAVILCLRTVGLKWTRFEAVLCAFLMFEVTYPFWLDVTDIRIRLILHATNSVLLLAGVAIILKAAARPLRWAYKIEVAALSVMAVLMCYEIARYWGWADIEDTVLRLYHVPLVLLAIGAAIFERHVLAVWRIEQANVQLEQRVQEKAREIEAYHVEREQVMRQQALTAERHRILTDMHDGLGASLVGLLRYVQSRPEDAPGIEQRVKEALQEMRIAIDALEPAEGDLAVVLGKLRYRLGPLMEAAGVRLAWDVAALPSVEALDPSAVFAIQRVVLEAISNALRHSAATEIRLVAQPKKHGIHIQIEDDGRGFRPDDSEPGLGLNNMRTRVHRLGGQFEVSSQAGGGTRVIFTIPYTVATEAAVPQMMMASAGTS